MIQTIQIGHLLRETVASPYRNLVTRPTGAAVRNRIEDDARRLRLPHRPARLLRHRAARLQLRRRGRGQAAAGRRRAGGRVSWCCRASARTSTRRSSTCSPTTAWPWRPWLGRRRRRAAAARLGHAPTRARRSAASATAARSTPASSRRCARLDRARAPRPRWRPRRCTGWSAPRASCTTRSDRMSRPPPRPLDHRHPRHPAPPARLGARRPAHPAEQHLRQSRSAPTRRSSTAATATIPTRSRWPQKYALLEGAEDGDLPRRAAWAPRRWPTWPCSAPATTSSAAAGSTAAPSTSSTRSWRASASTSPTCDPTSRGSGASRSGRPPAPSSSRRRPTRSMRVLDLGPVAHVAARVRPGPAGGRHLRQPDQLPAARARRRRRHHQRHQVPQRPQRRHRRARWRARRRSSRR